MGYFELPNRFKLIDTDNVLISGDGVLFIREPQDFEEVELVLKRDEETHGVMFEFTEEETPWKFDRSKVDGETYSAYDLIKAIYDDKGVDGRCEFVIESSNDSAQTFVEDYKGELDFSTYREVDYAINMLSRRVMMGDKFRTRYETPINLAATNDLDGNAITGITAETMHLHSKAIQQIQRSNVQNLQGGGDDLDGATNFFLNLYVQNETGVTDFLDSLQEEYGNEIQTILYRAKDEMPANYVFEDVGGALKFNVTANYQIVVEDMDDETLTLNGLFAEVDGVEVAIDDFTTDYDVNGTLGLGTIDVSYTSSGIISVPIDSSIKIYEKWNIPDTAAPHAVVFNYETDNEIEITFYNIQDNSEAKVYKASDALTQAVEVITGQGSALNSTFLSDHEDNIYITNGYAIRNFNQSNKPAKFSLKDMFSNFLQPVYGLGMSLLRDGAVHKLAVERHSYFYNDSLIFNIPQIINDTYEVTIDRDLHFNEIKTGYASFPKSTDENKFNNIDEFNTEHNHLSPLERVKMKAEYISKAIASGYNIENQRREQFKKSPTETVSNDDNMFVIHGLKQTTYAVKKYSGDPENIIFDATENTIKLFGTYFNIVSESVTLAGTGMSNAGTYTVSSVVRDGMYTVLNVASVSTDEVHDDDYALTISAARLRAARDDEFDVLNGTISPQTIYNGGINPKYMLLNNSNIFNSGFRNKLDADKVRSQDVKLNEDATFELKTGEGAYVLGGEGVELTMNEDVALSDINSRNALFKGTKVQFEAPLKYSDYQTIKDGLTDLNDDNLHGYIQFTDMFGNTRQGFPLEITYNLSSEIAIFVLREKVTA